MESMGDMKGLLISRVTLYSFLLALTLGLGIRVWYPGPRDACSTSPAANRVSSEFVVIGKRMVQIKCTDWIGRMPMSVQILWFTVVVLGIVCGLNMLGDLRDWSSRKRPRRAGIV
jgi:polyferredoxin